jgi:MFS family permease
VPSLWQNSDFRRLWVGQTASQLGEHAGLVVLPLIAVLSLHADAGQVGVLRAVGQTPILLLSLLVGAWVDGWRTRTVMVLADVGRAVALGGAAVAVLLGGLGLPALFVVAFVVGTFLSIARMRWREAVPERSGRTPRVWGQIFAGLRMVFGDVALRTVCLASAAFQFFFAATMTAYLIFLTRELHLSGTAVGLALAAVGPGALVGSLLAARLPERFGYGTVLVSAALAGDGVMLFVPALHGPPGVTIPALVAINFVFGTFGQLVNVTVMAIRQAVTPDRMQGRAAATINFVGMGMTPFGSLLGGVLAVQWGLRTSLLVTAAGMLLSPALMALSPLARLGREIPAVRSSGDADQ